VAKDKISIYTYSEGEFFKIVAFKETNRTFLNRVAVHIEGSRHPTICMLI
jgi:hypothetical protein